MSQANEHKSPSVASHSCTDGNSIEQEFKELNIYLDHLCRQKEKDAGHLWIAFIDKFNAFQRRILTMLNKGQGVQVSDTTEDDSSTKAK